MASISIPEPDTNTATYHDEETPLLERASPMVPASRWRILSRQHPVTLFLLLIVLIEIGVYLQIAPLNEVMEEIICHNYLAELKVGAALASPQDPRCKNSIVQGRLAMLRGWQTTFDSIPGVLTAIPFGLMSDRYGRKIVLALALSGLTLACLWIEIVCWWPDVFPVWLTWFSSAFYLIGGGGTVVASMVYTMISDVVPHAERATYFFRLAAATIIGEMIASPLSASLMEHNVWLPIFLGLGSLLLANWVSLILPETLGHKEIETTGRNPVGNIDDENISEHEALQTITERKDVWYWLKSQGQSIESITKFLQGNKLVILLLFTFLITSLGRFVSEILMQYITKRFNWTWSQAAYVMTIRAASNLALLLVFLPMCSSYLLTRLSFSAERKDLWLARTSCLLLLFGALTIGFAVNPIILAIGLVIFSFGGGYNALIRSILTSLVEQHHIGTLYNMIAVIETVGQIFAGPLLSGTFRQGMDMGGAWIGLPFIVAGGLFATAAVVVFSVRLPNMLQH